MKLGYRWRAACLAVPLVAATAAAADGNDLRADALAFFGRVEAPAPEALAAPEAELGRALFWDARVSADGRTACASCHAASDWSADRLRFSLDARGEPTSRHSQPIFNSMQQPALRWLGDRKDGAAQAEGSLTGSLGFASKAAALEALDRAGYRPRVEAVYAGDRALMAYQATLTTPAPFDRYLAGDDGALDATQKAGLRAFIDVGCAACHGGPLLGGGGFQTFGLARDYWRETGSERVDPGRIALTKKDEDRNVFRVPMLRNVARTAPYFHDGSVARLDQAVAVMARVQFDRDLEPAELAAIVSFLDALTGPIPANYAPPGGRVEQFSRN
jgi:cytochrome c peroxidase